MKTARGGGGDRLAICQSGHFGKTGRKEQALRGLPEAKQASVET